VIRRLLALKITQQQHFGNIAGNVLNKVQ